VIEPRAPDGRARISADDPAAQCMDRIAGQRVVFAERPRRLDLLSLRASWPLAPIRVRVHRNQPFEFVASVLRPFLECAGLEASLEFGPYDDSLGALGAPPESPADVEIVWLDFERYLAGREPEAVAEWLAARMAVLRDVSAAPILVAGATGRDEGASRLNGLLEAALAGLPGALFVDLAAVARDLGEGYFDARSLGFAGSSLSDEGAIETARRFGLVWIPEVVSPRLKVVAVDLDNTLYEGVLGEDGPAALTLTPDRAALQARLVELADSGMLLAVVSRNEPDDVRGLFQARPDFPLRPERLSAIEASWRPKAEGLAAIGETLRVGPDAILLVDDNPGELAAACAALAGVKPLHAADAGQALRGLRLHPGLAAARHTREDALRAADLGSMETRRALQKEASDPAAYVKSLGLRLTFALAPHDHLARIHELSVKTNQFNTGFLRLSEVEAGARLTDPSAVVVTVGLADRLADSGIVGLVVVRLAGPAGSAAVAAAPPVVEEVAISCRALGRGVEDAIAIESVRGALGDALPDLIHFAFRPGPRNGPAREWLERLAGRPVGEDGATVPWPQLESARLAVAGLVEMSWRPD
jgi:FkbH-like protein